MSKNSNGVVIGVLISLTTSALSSFGVALQANAVAYRLSLSTKDDEQDDDEDDEDDEGADGIQWAEGVESVEEEQQGAEGDFANQHQHQSTLNRNNEAARENQERVIFTVGSASESRSANQRKENSLQVGGDLTEVTDHEHENENEHGLGVDGETDALLQPTSSDGEHVVNELTDRPVSPFKLKHRHKLRFNLTHLNSFWKKAKAKMRVSSQSKQLFMRWQWYIGNKYTFKLIVPFLSLKLKYT
jgi:hypothetical protein